MWRACMPPKTLVNEVKARTAAALSELARNNTGLLALLRVQSQGLTRRQPLLLGTPVISAELLQMAEALAVKNETDRQKAARGAPACAKQCSCNLNARNAP